MLNLSAPIPEDESSIRAELAAIEQRWQYFRQRPAMHFPFEGKMEHREEVLEYRLAKIEGRTPREP